MSQSPPARPRTSRLRLPPSSAATAASSHTCLAVSQACGSIHCAILHTRPSDLTSSPSPCSHSAELKASELTRCTAATPGALAPHRQRSAASLPLPTGAPAAVFLQGTWQPACSMARHARRARNLVEQLHSGDVAAQTRAATRLADMLLDHAGACQAAVDAGAALTLAQLLTDTNSELQLAALY